MRPHFATQHFICLVLDWLPPVRQMIEHLLLTTNPADHRIAPGQAADEATCASEPSNASGSTGEVDAFTMVNTDLASISQAIEGALDALPATRPWTASDHHVGCDARRDICRIHTYCEFLTHEAWHIVAYLIACRPGAIRALLAHVRQLEAA